MSEENIKRTKVGNKIYVKSTEPNPIINSKIRKATEVIDRAQPKVRHPTSLHPVTDLNYYMDGYLKDNLNEVPRFLKKAWDCVIIVTGTGKVRIGKSTCAMQIAYYLAWLLNEQKKKKGEVPKDNPVPFNNINVAFDPDELMKVADKLPRNSVIVYDEGRAGLDSARAMENINKAMQDFFQECGQYGHVIVIVLPDFFKLNETIAIPRSLFLINVYTNRNYDRGYFSFFSEHRKELLYIIGKKKWGSTSKYLAVDDNFHGKFTQFFPINQEIYAQKKKEAIKKKKKNRLEVRWRLERDFSWYIMKRWLEISDEDIAKELKKYPDIKISKDTVTRALINVRKRLEREGYDVDDEEN